MFRATGSRAMVAVAALLLVTLPATAASAKPQAAVRTTTVGVVMAAPLKAEILNRLKRGFGHEPRRQPHGPAPLPSNAPNPARLLSREMVSASPSPAELKNAVGCGLHGNTSGRRSRVNARRDRSGYGRKMHEADP